MGAHPAELAPGEYWFEDLPVGAVWRTGGLVITESHIVGFAGLSGDFFDVHMDDDFARSQGFTARLAHGLLGLALTDGLKNRASVKLMAVASLGWDWRFVGPIVAGDRIAAVISMREKRLSSQGKGIVTLQIEVSNQRNEIAQKGSTTLIVRKRDEDMRNTVPVQGIN
ncbi:MaoC/PaaZ C-terminal domain-containing protein [Rhizobium sp. BE258]|jgi:acyl dehydratase|uniref:MaoC family dehydratase n=1 Tax=Rhizobium sp. BE258 TaxID=2817722 RepID=UPI00285FF2F7|nr:MaoC/PaaZ C-terminal domain-containing protein [Rhizobium sp. BE258]MDR7147751.1 acyl dehydratase [Rhizobium sp. BE258]